MLIFGYVCSIQVWEEQMKILDMEGFIICSPEMSPREMYLHLPVFCGLDLGTIPDFFLSYLQISMSIYCNIVQEQLSVLLVWSRELCKWLFHFRAVV